MKIDELERRPIPGYEGLYSATVCGKIISERRQIILRPDFNSKVYFWLYLYCNGKRKRHMVHRLVGAAFGLIELTDPKQQIDHIDNDRLNNCLENLRAATSSNNNAWGPKLNRATNKSGYRGVHWAKAREKWRAQITFECKNKHLGYFNEKLDAARAYDKAAKRHFGEFARPNLSEEGEANA